MSLSEALSRTLLLMRTDLVESISDGELLAALTGTRIGIAIGADALATHSGQSALVTAALLMARSGHEIWLDLPKSRMLGPQPPLSGPELRAALDAAGRDLLPGRAFQLGRPPASVDVGVAIGAAPAPDANLTLYVSADDWSAWIGSEAKAWRANDWPMGGLAAGALAACEVFKSAMRRLTGVARDPGYFADLMAPATGTRVRLAPEGMQPPATLPDFDIVSGGAIANAALFALYRLPGLNGRGRVLDDDVSALSNLNRNALLMRSALDRPKVDDLTRFGRALALEPVPVRYQEGLPLASTVLVGVDDIPSRWAAQRQHPSWLGVGATEGFSLNISAHEPGVPCAGCLHPVHRLGEGPIPTAAFVSFWSGLHLVAYWLRKLADHPVPATEQQFYGNALRPDSWTYAAMPIAPHGACPVGCAASKAVVGGR